MKIVFFKKRKFSITDQLISIGTGDEDYSHVGIVFNNSDVIFESSGKKGGVLAYRRLSGLKRPVVIYDLGEVGESLKDFAIELIGIKYDWAGVIFFIFNRQQKKKLYCFELVAKVLAQIEEFKDDIRLVRDGSVSGKDIEKILQKHGFWQV